MYTNYTDIPTTIDLRVRQRLYSQSVIFTICNRWDWGRPRTSFVELIMISDVRTTKLYPELKKLADNKEQISAHNQLKNVCNWVRLTARTINYLYNFVYDKTDSNWSSFFNLWWLYTVVSTGFQFFIMLFNVLCLIPSTQETVPFVVKCKLYLMLLYELWDFESSGLRPVREISTLVRDYKGGRFHQIAYISAEVMSWGFF